MSRKRNAAGAYNFIVERYDCIKYKNSPYYKRSMLWDSLPLYAKGINTIDAFK